MKQIKAQLRMNFISELKAAGNYSEELIMLCKNISAFLAKYSSLLFHLKANLEKDK